MGGGGGEKRVGSLFLRQTKTTTHTHTHTSALVYISRQVAQNTGWVLWRRNISRIKPEAWPKFSTQAGILAPEGERCKGHLTQRRQFRESRASCAAPRSGCARPLPQTWQRKPRWCSTCSGSSEPRIRQCAWIVLSGQYWTITSTKDQKRYRSRNGCACRCPHASNRWRR